MGSPSIPLLRAPPFPGSRLRAFGRPARDIPSDAELDGAIEVIAAMRVGGSYWGRRPSLPGRPYALVRVRDERNRLNILAAMPADRPVVCWSASKGGQRPTSQQAVEQIFGCCDPWHLIDGADEVFGDADDELVVIAALAGKRTIAVGESSQDVAGQGRAALRNLVRRHPTMKIEYSDPFTAEPMTLTEAVELCAFWKRLIDGNRPLVAAIGFAAWKRPTVAPLLWAGSTDVAFSSKATKVRAGDQVAMWKSRIAPATLVDLQRRQAHLVEVEDGFIRSIGLGAECVPPLSLVVDRLGAYFDPSGPSELELMIEQGNFEPLLLRRAQALRQLIVEHGVSKYAAGKVSIKQRSRERRHLLVAGQVEDDRSMLCGGGAVTTNLILLRRVRELAPDAFITYKPHPDVEAGHRVGAIPRPVALSHADEVVSDQPIGALIDAVDEVHVNTSLAGFEALMRGRAVTTHGVPFYAGWGLTVDLGSIPERRTARRTLDELVAAVLLLYPRYLDPDSGLPCPPEILIQRLASAAGPGSSNILVNLRRLQGRLKRGLVTLQEMRRA